MSPISFYSLSRTRNASRRGAHPIRGGNKSSSKSYAKVERIRNSCGPPQPSWKAKRSETFRQMRLAIPGVDAGQIDVLPAQRRDVFQQRVWNGSSCSLQVRDRAVDIDSIPVYDRTNDEIETGGAEGLTLERSVTDLATLVEEDGAFEFVRSLALVESSLTAPAQCRARIPFDHEQRSLDAAQFPQRLRELAFLRRRRELLQDRRWHDRSRRDRRRETKQIIPMVEDQGGVDRYANVVR
jgi:hypothetical protein